MNNFQKIQAAKILAAYMTPEELEDLEKGHPVGYINAHGKQKQADGSWKYVGKGKATKQESKPESNPEQDAIEEHFENKRKNLHETHTKEVNAHYEKMNADSLHHQKLYNDAVKENKPIEELKKLNDAHNESHIKNQEDLKALHSKHDGERAALIKEYSEARKKAKEDSKPEVSEEKKQADGSWKYVGKKKATKTESVKQETSTRDDSSIKLGQSVEISSVPGKGTIMDINREKRIAEVFSEDGTTHDISFDDIHAGREKKNVDKKESSPKETKNNTIPSGMQSSIQKWKDQGYWVGETAEKALGGVDISKLEKLVEEVSKYAIGKVQVEFDKASNGVIKMEFNDVSVNHHSGKHFDNAPDALTDARDISNKSGQKVLGHYVTSVSSTADHFTLDDLKKFIQANK